MTGTGTASMGPALAVANGRGIPMSAIVPGAVFTFCGTCLSAPCGCTSTVPPMAVPPTQLSNEQLRARIADLQRQQAAAVGELHRRTGEDSQRQRAQRDAWLATQRATASPLDASD